MVLMINDGVEANAGGDQWINFGASTQLNGSATGGTGTLLIQWQPADKLINANTLNPTTLNLTETTVFTLTVTDAASQCVGNDEMNVFVDNSTLGVSAHADPLTVCFPDSSQLSAIAGGGSGNYTYSWISDPAGFTSTLQNPVVWPQANTLYTVTVNDGNTTAESSVSVSIDTLVGQPTQPFGPTQVNPENTASSLYTCSGSLNTTSYIWEINPINAGTLIPSGNTCQVLWNPFQGYATLTVSGSNACGNGQVSPELSIFVSPTVGLINSTPAAEHTVWPNPVDDFVYIKLGQSQPHQGTIYSANGQKVFEFQLSPNQNIQSLNLAHLANGLYVMVLQSSTKSSMYKLLILRK
jgi:hypothetical protein